MSSPFVPSSFSYNDAPQGGALMPMIIAGRNPSNTIDKQYAAGYFWLSSLDIKNSNGTTGSGNMYYQGGNSGGTPSWTLVSNSGGVLNTLSDGVTTVSPTGGNIALVGTTSQITVTSSAPSHELIFSIPNTFIAPGSIEATSSLESGTTLVVGTDATVNGDLLVNGDAHVVGNLVVDGTITLTDLTVDGTVAINTTGSGTTNVGNASAGAITIDVGTGDFQVNGGGNEIHIGDDAANNIIVVGTDSGSASLHLQAGTGDLLIDGAVTTAITIGDVAQTGLITLGLSTAGENISIGDGINVGAQTISIGNGASGANSTVNILSGSGTAGAGVLALGNNTRVTTIGLGNVAPAASRTTTVSGGTITTAVTDTLNLGTGGATTNASATKTVNLNSGGVTLGSVLTNIATGAVTSGTHTTAIATGNRAAGTMALNLMTGTGTKTATLGNADGLTTFNILAVANINASQNSNTNINTGTSTGTVAIGNSLATAATIDAVTFSIDATANSNVTVTGAGADLTLNSSGGSVLVESTENTSLAIRLHANGGTSETIQIHSDQGTGVASVGLLSDVGGLTFRATGLASADAINLEAPAGGIDVDAALQINITSSQAAADALRLLSSAGGIDVDAVGSAGVDINILNTGGSVVISATESTADSIKIESTAGGIDILASGASAGEDIDIIATGSSVNITATEAVANAIVLSASNAAGGIDITTGGGSIDLSSAGAVTMVANAASVASPTASSTQNFNVGAATFTGFTTASAGTQTFTITNSLVSATSQLFVSIANEGTNDARMQIQRVKRLAGSFEVYTINAGAAALNGNTTITWWVIG